MSREFKGYKQIAVRFHEERDSEALRILSENPIHDTMVKALLLYEKDKIRREKRAARERERRAARREAKKHAEVCE